MKTIWLTVVLQSHHCLMSKPAAGGALHPHLQGFLGFGRQCGENLALENRTVTCWQKFPVLSDLINYEVGYICVSP